MRNVAFRNAKGRVLQDGRPRFAMPLTTYCGTTAVKERNNGGEKIMQECLSSVSSGRKAMAVRRLRADRGERFLSAYGKR